MDVTPPYTSFPTRGQEMPHYVNLGFSCEQISIAVRA
jgi:hypothetical protein